MPKWKAQDRTVCIRGTVVCGQAEDDAECGIIVDAHNADIDAMTAERDEWQSRCESMVAKRTLAKHRNVKMWKVPAIGESLIDIGTDQCVMVGGRFWREDLVIAHNNDIIALNHCADILADVISGLTDERDELQRRLDAVVMEHIRTAELKCYCEFDRDHVRTLECEYCEEVATLRAIAEGREA